MWDELGMQLIQALAAAATERLGAEHPFVSACRTADLANVRSLMDRLTPDDADAVLADAHKLLREDDAGVLAQWRPGDPLAH